MTRTLLARSLALVLLLGCRGKSPLLVAPADELRVPHARHQQAKVDCIACHETVFDAKDLSARHLPPEAKCLECHKEEKEAGKCGFCHKDARLAAGWPGREATLQLSHAAHIERVKEDCSRCHTQLPEPGRPAAPPKMAACLGCHEHKEELEQARCDRCHVDLLRYALRPVSALSHQLGFARSHGRLARTAADACAKCHDQTFCADCHAATVALRVEVKYPEAVERDFIHRADFASRHPAEARADGALCRRCHGSSFCESCHAQEGLSSTAKDPRSPHPAGYAFPGTGRHARDARRDIATCAACHDQGARSICVDCHRVGGVGCNPHPRYFTRRHGQAELATNPTCLVCHR